MNNTGLEYTGVEAARFGNAWETIIHPNDVGEAGVAWERAVREGALCETGFRLRRARDGAYRWHLAISSPVRDGEGRIVNWVGTCMDVEDTKRANFERAQAIYREKAAVEAARVKSEFLANMSHEIRTPLNGILGAAELLAEAADTDFQKKYSRIIQSSGNSLLVIINDILDFSKIEAGQLAIEQIDFSMSHTLTGQVELLTKRATEKGLALAVEIDPRIPRSVKGDPGRIGQVLLNLISNAIKFTREGAVTVRADLVEGVRVAAPGSAAPDPGSVSIRFSVRDQGIGMDAAVQGRLFQPFMQADTSTARQYGGTGLGLSICKRLVEIMGGQIGVESAVGQGSEFWFTLTLKVAEAPSAGEDAADDAPAVAETARKLRRILVVEDNSINQALAVANLQKLGYQVQVASNGREALAATENDRFDLVLMDCQMPEMDGFEATRRIREREASVVGTGHVPIVALTANALAEDKRRCLECGMDDYLAKPVRRTTLEAMLNKWLAPGAEPRLTA